MNLSPQMIDNSYSLCQELARRAGSSFYRCFLPLPRPKRRAMDALYAFMRHTDDLGDSQEPVEARREGLIRWRAALEAALLGHSGIDHGNEPQALGPGLLDDLTGMVLLPAVADTVRRFAIPPQHLHAVIDGVERDLRQQRYETFDELAEYCQQVASAVGLACICVWGFRGEAALEPARKCGIALQLTNILRDLKEDLEQGRVYLPLADLRQCDYSIEDLAGGVVDDRFERLVKLQIDRARRLYHEGAELLEHLEPDGRRSFGMMIDTYYRLLGRIERCGGGLLERRVRLGRWERLRIAGRWLLFAPRRDALP